MINLTDIPCSRYEGGESNQRVAMTLATAVALSGPGARHEVQRLVVRVHDHKGTLYVVTRWGLSDGMKAAFRDAWRDVGFELPENVEFLDYTDADWGGVWGARRFDSDWRVSEGA